MNHLPDSATLYDIELKKLFRAYLRGELSEWEFFEQEKQLYNSLNSYKWTKKPTKQQGAFYEQRAHRKPDNTN